MTLCLLKLVNPELDYLTLPSNFANPISLYDQLRARAAN
jgi:hypothetical protein